MAGINFTTNEQDEINLNKVRDIALKNGLKTTKPELFKLSARIANSAVKLNSKDFAKLTGLNK